MKVSIITYHDEDNYGATLQAYATYKAVESLGYKPEIINLHLPYRFSLATKLVFSLKRWRLNSFRKRFMPVMTKVYHSVDELRQDPPSSDVYLVGSDQTWNPTISRANALAYFLDFGGSGIKRISYASSFGVSHWEDSDVAKKEKVQELLARFSTLLVRESNAVDILRDEFGLASTQVVDPVLLFPSYPELTGDIGETDRMIVYKIKNDAEFYKKAVTIGQRLGCNIHSVGSMRRLEGIHTHYPERIEDWVKNIGTARYVFTDSFHGTVLSLLYHRQFVVYVGEAKKLSRLSSLLKLLGLENRICSGDDNLEKIKNLLQTPIDYKNVDEILNKERKNSLACLRKAIENKKK